MEVLKETGALVKMWTDHVLVEDKAKAQLLRTASLPFVYKHLAVMPDVHWGMGSTIGSVVPTIRAIIPAAVGVDIGCGMIAQRLNLTAKDLPDNLAKARSRIEEEIPSPRRAEMRRQLEEDRVQEDPRARRPAGAPTRSRKNVTKQIIHGLQPPVGESLEKRAPNIEGRRQIHPNRGCEDRQ